MNTLPPALAAARDVMRGYAGRWAVAGGWAIDLALGAESRAHADVDLAAFRDEQSALRSHLAGWRWECVVAGVVRPWPAVEWLALPVHELYATPPDPDGPRLEILLNERDGADWVHRRDARVRLSMTRAIVDTANGLPALAPEVALLFKAKAPRAIDEADFATARPRLGAESRAWLADALARCHAGHPWIAALAVTSHDGRLER